MRRLDGQRDPVVRLALARAAAANAWPHDPAWLAATDIYWDPAGTKGGHNGNDGVTQSTPVFTWQEVLRRYGSTSPELPHGQSLVVHQLTAQPLNQDDVFFSPKMSGGAQLWLYGTLVPFTAPFTAGTITPSVRGAPGSPWTIANLPAGVTAGMRIHDQTQDSYATIVSMSGATATITKPIAGAGFGVLSPPPPQGLPLRPGGSMATGDTLVVNNPPINCNLKEWRAISTDNGTQTGGANSQQVGGTRVQFISIADTSAASTGAIKGTSRYMHRASSIDAVLACCTIPGWLVCASADGGAGAADPPIGGCYLIDCDAIGPTIVTGFSTGLQGGVFRGGMLILGGTVSSNEDPMILGGGPWGALVVGTGCAFVELGCYLAAPALVRPGGVLSLYNQGHGPLWGPGSLELQAGGTCTCVTSLATSFAVSLQLSGPLKLAGKTTGTKYVAGVWTDGIPLTVANLDEFGGLQDPISGARFCVDGTN